LEAWHQPLRVLKEHSSSALGLRIPDLPKIPAYHLKLGQPTPSWPSLLRPSIAITRSTGILGLSAWVFFTPIIVTHVSIRTSDTSSKLLNSPSQAYRTLLYRITCVIPVASVYGLSPVKSSAQADSTSELLRFL
jgi:hypothetical protein